MNDAGIAQQIEHMPSKHGVVGLTPIARSTDFEKTMILDVVKCRAELFREDFHGWLSENWPIWKEFERRSMSIWSAGRKHFSHRTVWEAIRFNTALREKDDKYKLNNNYTKSCAQLFILMNPACEGLFEFRSSERV